MKTNLIFFKLLFLYCYMYLIGPLIWGIWMVCKLQIITGSEFVSHLISPVALVLFFSYFLFNFLYMSRVLQKRATIASALKVHIVSLLTFGTIATSVFMMLPSATTDITTGGYLGHWQESTILGIVSGTSLVFLFYTVFSVILFTSAIEHKAQIPPPESQKILLQLKTFNQIVYGCGMLLFCGTAVASFLLRTGTVTNRETLLYVVTMAFPMYMSGLLYLKSLGMIRPYLAPCTATSHVNKIPSRKSALARFRILISFLLLFIFLLLLLLGKMKLWLLLLVVGFFISFLPGRIYCRWICPSNSMNFLIATLYKRLGLKKKVIPDALPSWLVRSIWFTLLAGFILYSFLSGRRLPFFPLLTFTGVLVSCIFVSSFWCHVMCPWGVIFCITGKCQKTKPAKNKIP